MSTATSPAGSERPRVPLFWKIVSLASTAILLIGILVIGWVVMIARRALPQLDGTVSVSGISAPVTVVRDAQGVPTISAGSRHDLLFAQGYVTAQDRLWQMDVLRRSANGTLAEILGARVLRHDIEQRYLLLGPVAARTAASLSPEDREDFQAYSDGVNAFIAEHANRLPVEFRILKYQPRPWTPTDSLLLGLHMNVMLANFWPVELQRERLTVKLGPELAADLYVNTSWRDHPPGAESGDHASQPAKDDDEDDEDEDADRQRADVLPDPAHFADLVAGQVLGWSPELTLPGSNNWVVSGAHTVTGKPLLANDMHLPHQIPNLWYEAHLKGGGLDVAGVTLPGTPFVIVGHNQRIAWGFTNLGANVQDLYIETANDKGEFQTPDGWKAPVRIQELVKVKGGKDVALNILASRHGPIISDLVPGEKRKIALAWTIYTPNGVPGSFREINAAQNWDEFCRAFAKFPGPAQNVVYADVDGHIGYHAVGLVPLRKKGDGSVPVPGNVADYDWTESIPFDKLPSVFDPPSGIIATANSRVTPNRYPYLVSDHWMPPYRVERIYKVLQSGKKFSAADMLALQMDIYSDFDKFVADKLVYAVDHTPKASANARTAADILRSWDGRMSADSAAPTIETSARNQIFLLLLRPKLGPDVGDYDWWMAPVALEQILDNQPARWLPREYANYNELLVAALEAGLTQGTVPRKLEDWKWGEQAKVTLEHPILGQMKYVKRWAGPGAHPISGGSFTVKQLTPGIGPSERMTVDLADLDRSTLNTVAGQSGQIFSRYFEDQFKAWYDGVTFPLPFSDTAVAAAKKHELTLEPKK